MAYSGGYSSDVDEDDAHMASIRSLASTAHDMIVDYGRHFPGRGIATFPRGDELAKQNEIHLENVMLHLNNDRLYTAPIEEPKNVLDVRCGHLGLWAKNMADRFEDSQITGCDDFVPDGEGRPNLQFIIQNFNHDWTLDDVTTKHGLFDMIYAKVIFASSRDYPKFYKQCLDHLQPGGYLEQSEMVPYARCDDDTYKQDGIIKNMCDLTTSGILDSSWDTTYDLASNMTRWIKEAGFVDVQQRFEDCPWSPWHPKGTREHHLGELFQLFFETGIQGWMIRPLVQGAGMSEEDVNAMCQAVFLELRKNDQHIYSPRITVTARKPLEAPS